MNIRVAEHAGFCFGVKKAVEIAEKAAQEGGPVYTFGEIIHNNQVVELLKKKGIQPIPSFEALTSVPPPFRLIIRAHGAPPALYQYASENGIALIDATCPYVKRIHSIVRAEAEAGSTVYIAGKSDHPEVTGILGWAGSRAYILENAAMAEALPNGLPRSCLVAQTTLRPEVFSDIFHALSLCCKALTVHNTICDTTVLRQTEAAQLASECSKMVVLGSPHSSNTQKLAEICKKYCRNTQSIENSGELLLENLSTNDIIGVVAGASTPQWMIREVVTVMNELEKTTVESTEVEAPAEPAEVISAEVSESAVSEAVAAEAEAAAVEAAQESEPEEVEEKAAVPESAQAEEEPQSAPEETAKEAEAQAPAETPDQAPEAETAPETDAAPEEEDASQEADAGKESFAEAFEKTMVRIRNGQMITGSVVQITDGEVCVNIGYKSDGFIPKNEFSSDPDVNPADIVKVGDPIEVEVIKVNDGEGNVLLSRKSVEGKKLWEELMQDAEAPDKIFDAVGKDVVKGGLTATINGVRAFVPASHVSTKYVENLSEFIGKPMRLQIIEVDKARKRIVASQKNVLLFELEKEKKEKWNVLEVNAKITGTVRRLTDFGAFVDIGGIDGLVHVTDIAWGRVKHPSDVLKIGQQIEVLIMSVDAEKERVSLGYKQLQPKPWTMAAEKYPIGSVVEGKVVRIVPFGAFVALEPTIDGLIHISQVSVRRIAKVEDELNVGDIVRCKVLDVNSEAKRISLSRKEVILEENPEIAEQLSQERAERDRQYAERQEQRATERQQRAARSTSSSGERTAAPQRTEFTPAPQQERSDKGDRGEKSERRPRREGADYDLPPVQSTTTSLADLFQGLNMTDLPEGEGEGETEE